MPIPIGVRSIWSERGYMRAVATKRPKWRRSRAIAPVLFDVEDAHYGPWASALSFVLAEMPDLALTALGEGALQVAEHQTPAGVRLAMVDSYGEIARLLEERGKEGHAQVARRLAGDMAH